MQMRTFKWSQRQHRNNNNNNNNNNDNTIFESTTQHQQLDASRENYREKQDKGQHIREDTRKMVSAGDAWTIPT